ncbi:3'-5' exoribonuclease YhaM family protein [Desulfogranum mediterraneum]|uniref:3'-5' exoribonuclease YhaM family protein n=1 Tax=Desulfogranum mediterraneum TaxID=160661 RepID=UPI0009FED6EF|nr:HD domain-containing protein [Desulfogranum mediterraneum]
MEAIPHKKVFINQLRQGQQLQELFLLARKTLAETKAGKPYLALGLMDRSGEIEARLWDNAAHYDAQAQIGDFVLVQATAKSYRDQLQLGVVSLKRVDESEVALEQFMPASPRPLAEMERELSEVLADICDPALGRLLREIFQGETLASFVRAPAAKKMHHAYIGGLLEHTLSMVAMAKRTADHYPMLDQDMLVAGALLHDIAKIEEFQFARLPFDYTDQGRLVGHLVLGTELVRRAAARVSELDPERLDQLLHMILSHHGQLEYGSPVLPMTPEAMLLHHLDDMDAKMNYLERLRNQLSEPGWQWTDYQRPLERFLYLRGVDEEELQRQHDQQRQGRQAPRRKRASCKKSEAEKKQQSLF